VSCWVHIAGGFIIDSILPALSENAEKTFIKICKFIFKTFGGIKIYSEFLEDYDQYWAGEPTFAEWAKNTVPEYTNSSKPQLTGSEGSIKLRVLPLNEANSIPCIFLCIAGDLRDRGETEEDTKEIAETLKKCLEKLTFEKNNLVSLRVGSVKVVSESGYKFTISCYNEKLDLINK